MVTNQSNTAQPEMLAPSLNPTLESHLKIHFAAVDGLPLSYKMFTEMTPMTKKNLALKTSNVVVEHQLR